MDVAVICFTLKGYILAERIRDTLKDRGDEVCLYTKSRYLEDQGSPVKVSLTEWAGEMFETRDAIIFVGATGICIRAIAPYVESKRRDPAVIVFDEKGIFCIPLLSGHIGGANELAAFLCDRLGSTPVLTTATDVNGLFAVDVFAKKNNLEISSMKLAKEVSARLLAGEKVGFSSELTIKGNLPEELAREDQGSELGIYVGIYDQYPFKQTLQLIPKTVFAGIGCKKDTPKEKIAALFGEILKEENINPQAIAGIASIDLKKDESGLLEFAGTLNIEPVFFTAEELLAVEGDFTESDFVRSVTGVDNVCERAALRASEGGKIIHRKTGREGVTVALALKEKEISFE